MLGTAGVGMIRRKMIRGSFFDLKNDPRIIFSAMIRHPDHFFSYDPRSMIRIIFSMIRSDSVQIT